MIIIRFLVRVINPDKQRCRSGSDSYRIVIPTASANCFLMLLLLALLLPTLSFAQSDSSFIWAKKSGGTLSDDSHSIVVDVSGNVYTIGSFQGAADFDPGTGTANLSSAGGADIFVSKLDASGNFIWAKKMGGTNSDYGFSIAVDAGGNVYATGTFKLTADFDPGAAVFNLTSVGSDDIFVSKFDSSGNFIWAKQLGGTNTDYASSIAVDPGGNIYITGYFFSTADFDPGAGVFNLTSKGSEDVFVSKLDSSGNFIWAKQIGGAVNEYGYSIDIDAVGNVYTTGYFWDTCDFDPGTGAFNLISLAQSWDIFVSKLDSSGNFIWAKQLGGTITDYGYSITIDVAGNIYTTGVFQNVCDFDPGTNVFNLSSSGGSDDVFVSKLDASGNFIWAKQLGGKYSEYGNSITVDAGGNVYTTGYFNDTADFDPGAAVFNLISAGSSDIFVSKLDVSGNFIWAKQLGGTSNDYGYSIAVDAGENVYTTGTFQGTADFDPGAGVFNLTASGFSDIFVSKLNPAQPTLVLVNPANSNRIAVYPNPGKGIFTIEIDDPGLMTYDLSVIDVLGREVFKSKSRKLSEQNRKSQINLNGYPAGVYFLQFKNENAVDKIKLFLVD